MTDSIKVRMDRGGVYSTVHGERTPDDRHALTQYYQNGLPFDAQGYLIMDHADFEAEKGDRCSAKAADLRGKAHTLIAQETRRQKKRAEEQARIDRQNPRRRSAPAPAPQAARPVPPPPVPVPPAPAPAGMSFDQAPPPDAPETPHVDTAGDAPPPADEPFSFAETDADSDADDDMHAEDDDAESNGEDGDDEFDESKPVDVNMEAFLRGEEEVPWHILTQEIAVRYKRRVSNMKSAIEFLVEDPGGPKVIPISALAKKYQKHLS